MRMDALWFPTYFSFGCSVHFTLPWGQSSVSIDLLPRDPKPSPPPSVQPGPDTGVPSVGVLSNWPVFGSFPLAVAFWAPHENILSWPLLAYRSVLRFLCPTVAAEGGYSMIVQPTDISKTRLIIS